MAKSATSTIDFSSIDNLAELEDLQKQIETAKANLLEKRKTDARKTVEDLANEFGKTVEDFLVWVGLTESKKSTKGTDKKSKRAGDAEKNLVKSIHQKDPKAKFADVYAKYRAEKTKEMVDLKDNQIRTILIGLGKETKSRA